MQRLIKCVCPTSAINSMKTEINTRSHCDLKSENKCEDLRGEEKMMKNYSDEGKKRSGTKIVLSYSTWLVMKKQ